MNYNVGIVGYSTVAQKHIAELNKIANVDVTAVCSARDLDASNLSAKHGSNITVYHDLQNMLDNADIQIVSICSYSHLHAKQAVQSANAGKHLIIEKPIALTYTDLLAVQQAVEKNHVKVCVCFECRFSDQIQKTKQVLDAQHLGELHYAEVDYSHSIGPDVFQYRWNIEKYKGGSSLLSGGCHAMDALLFLMNGEVEEVSSYSTKSKSPDFAAYEYDTTQITLLKFKDGRVGKCSSLIDAIQPYAFRVHLFGSQGSLLNDHYTNNGKAWKKIDMQLLTSGEVHEHPFGPQFQAFFTALSNDKEMPLTCLADAIKTHQVIFSADRSAALGRPVKLSELTSEE